MCLVEIGDDWVFFTLIKILCMPFVAGLTYEFNRFAAGHCENRCIRLFIQPGLWLQRLTTKDPDESQLEVAIESLKAVMPQDKKEAEW